MVNKKMSEALRFTSKNCPQGSLAHHPTLGLVEVIGVNGLEREIKCEAFDDDFHPQTLYALTHVSKLRAVNYLRDFGLSAQSFKPHPCKIISITLAQNDSLDDDSSPEC
jgi:hypothetical protein